LRQLRNHRENKGKLKNKEPSDESLLPLESDQLTGVFQQCLRSVLTFDDFDELAKNQLNVGFGVGAKFDADLTDCPGGVVAYGDVLRVEVVAEDREEVSNVGMHVLEAGFRQITEEGER
jgi:hypothetical protein